MRGDFRFLLGVLVGAAMGAVGALIIAPMTGWETRQRLKDQLDTAAEKARAARKEAARRAKEAEVQALEMAESVSARAKQAAEEAEKRAEAAAERVRAGAVKVNLNTASREELMQVKGIGPASADSIIEYRNKHGRFNSVEELVNVYGFAKKETDKVKDGLRV